jgi:hypothetical protein
MSFRNITLTLLIGAALAACQPAPTAAPRPTPTSLRIQITPTLGTLAPLLTGCARRQSNLGIVLDERPASAFDAQYAGLSLTWGPPVGQQSFAYQLGEDRLSLIVHPDSPLKDLSRAQLQAIYNGSVQKWDALLQPTCKECAPDSAKNPLVGKEIHPWAYLPGEDIQNMFQTQIGLAARTGLNFLAPDPTAMRAAIAADPQAIGFLPQREVDASVKPLQLTGIKAEALRQPVTASLPAQPQAETRAWLACVAEELK